MWIELFLECKYKFYIKILNYWSVILTHRIQEIWQRSPTSGMGTSLLFSSPQEIERTCSEIFVKCYSLVVYLENFPSSNRRQFIVESLTQWEGTCLIYNLVLAEFISQGYKYLLIMFFLLELLWKLSKYFVTRMFQEEIWLLSDFFWR